MIRYRAQRGGVWYPEDRLRATYAGALFLVPMSILGAGIVTTYVEGRVGLVLCLVCIFMNGVGVRLFASYRLLDLKLPVRQVDFVLSPSATYVAHCPHVRGGVNAGVRAYTFAFMCRRALASL